MINKTWAKILEAVARRLEASKGYFVCHIIDEVATDEDQEVAEALKTEILRRLYPCTTVWEWLLEQDERANPDIQLYRAHWVREMALEFHGLPPFLGTSQGYPFPPRADQETAE